MATTVAHAGFHVAYGRTSLHVERDPRHRRRPPECQIASQLIRSNNSSPSATSRISPNAVRVYPLDVFASRSHNQVSNLVCLRRDDELQIVRHFVRGTGIRRRVAHTITSTSSGRLMQSDPCARTDQQSLAASQKDYRACRGARRSSDGAKACAPNWDAEVARVKESAARRFQQKPWIAAPPHPRLCRPPPC
jgi:hypothetical protein